MPTTRAKPRMAQGLATRNVRRSGHVARVSLPSIPRRRRRLVDQYGAEVVDVGIGRTRRQQVAEAGEKSRRSRCPQETRPDRGQAPAPWRRSCRRQRPRPDRGAASAAIGAVGIGRQPGDAAACRRGRAPAPAHIPDWGRRGRCPRDGDGQFAARKDDGAPACRLQLAGERGMRGRDVARLALRGRRQAGCSRNRPRVRRPAAARNASAGRATSRNSAPAKAGSPGFGVSLAGSASTRRTAAGNSSR